MPMIQCIDRPNHLAYHIQYEILFRYKISSNEEIDFLNSVGRQKQNFNRDNEERILDLFLPKSWCCIFASP